MLNEEECELFLTTLESSGTFCPTVHFNYPGSSTKVFEVDQAGLIQGLVPPNGHVMILRLQFQSNLSLNLHKFK